MIGERFNFEDVFFRDLTVCVLDTLEGQIKWNNRFSSGDVFVKVPIYYSLTGDERFLLDSFSDDIVSENRYVELNTDIIPRGHLTLTSYNIKSDEFANPNVWLNMVIENEIEIRKILTKVRAIPISVNYDLEIYLTSEIDTFKCSQAIMDTLWIYKFMYFEYNFMNIDAVISVPDNNTVQMTREKNLTSDNKISLKVSFTVDTYYPAFRSDKVFSDGYIRTGGSGMSDMNGYSMKGGVSSYFKQPVANGGGTTGGGNTGGGGTTGGGNTGGSVNGGIDTIFSDIDSISFTEYYNDGFTEGNTYVRYGGRGIFLNTKGTVNSSDYYGSEIDENFKGISPKRTKWFDNILKSRERNNTNLTNLQKNKQKIKKRD